MKKILIICFIALGMALTSCETQHYTTNNYTNHTTEEGLQILHLNTTVRQCLGNADTHSICLANYGNDVIFLFSVDATDIRNSHHFYYDYCTINDDYVLVGTYEYLAKSGDYRTVPALMLKRDYNDCKKYGGIEYLKKIINILTTYSILGESEYEKQDNQQNNIIKEL